MLFIKISWRRNDQVASSLIMYYPYANRILSKYKICHACFTYDMQQLSQFKTKFPNTF